MRAFDSAVLRVITGRYYCVDDTLVLPVCLSFQGAILSCAKLCTLVQSYHLDRAIKLILPLVDEGLNRAKSVRFLL